MKKLIIVLLIICTSILGQNHYDRHNWKHWIDADHDGQNTRQEVLIEENIADTIMVTKDFKKILKGKWICFFTGDTITDPILLDIDHVVPLNEAWRSGAWKWDKKKKKLYANDLTNKSHLMAVKASANRSKGDKDPSEWLPEKNICEYLNIWIQIKTIWSLEIDAKEKLAIEKGKNKYCQ